MWLPSRTLSQQGSGSLSMIETLICSVRDFFTECPSGRATCSSLSLRKVLDVITSAIFEPQGEPYELLLKVLFLFMLASGLRSSQLYVFSYKINEYCASCTILVHPPRQKKCPAKDSANPPVPKCERKSITLKENEVLAGYD